MAPVLSRSLARVGRVSQRGPAVAVTLPVVLDIGTSIRELVDVWISP
jgi:hypothetical protein